MAPDKEAIGLQDVHSSNNLNDTRQGSNWLTRCPSKQQPKWHQTRKPLAYEILHSVLEHINATGMYTSSSFGFFHQGSPQWIFHFQLFLSSASSSVTSTTAMSSLTTSINLLFGLPRFLFPGNSILSILLPIYPSSFLRTCPYHLSCLSCFLSKPSHLCRPSDVLVPDLVHSCHS